jgi:stringent starvation protein B
MTVRVPTKKQTLAAYLERGVAMVHLDARRPGVSVPPQFAQEAHLRLNLSYRYHIPDLVVGEERVEATLSFGGVPFRCLMPWEAIFGITSHSSGDGQVWPEDLPVEVVQTMAERRDRAGTPPQGVPSQEASAPARPPLSAVHLAPDEAPEEHSDPGTPKAPGDPPRRHLKLVR